MNRVLKIFIYLFSGLLVLITAGIAYLMLAMPRAQSAPEITLDHSEEQILRGKYLAWNVMQCVDCHSIRDFGQYSGPPRPGTELAGGERFDQTMGLPGVYISPNITPAGIGDWTDGELFRLITTGVKRDGEPIFPLMPYYNYGQMDEEDIKAVIAYLRTVEPIQTNHPKSVSDFPMNLIIRTLPKPAAFNPKPPRSDKIAYGKYMAIATGCGECHTNFEKGRVTGEFLAGGRVFGFPDGSVVRSPNITPHETGLKSWSEAQFVRKFKSFADSTYKPAVVAPDEFQTVMPWMMYAGLEDKDLEAIYAYIMTVPPVDHQVDRFTTAR